MRGESFKVLKLGRFTILSIALLERESFLHAVNVFKTLGSSFSIGGIWKSNFTSSASEAGVSG